LLYKTTPEQREIYSFLLQAWQEAEQQEAHEVREEKITTMERSLYPLKLKV